jgi:37-kD nucleoid-associated bacterial protein
VNLTTFFVESLIVHDVPRRTSEATAGAIVFSDAPSELDASLRNFFRERTIRSLTRQAYEVQRDPDQGSPVPRHVLDILADPEKLVARSQEIARHLWASQTGVNPAGLLVVILGKLEDAACVSILKLEREDAIRVAQTERDGHVSFNIAHLRDLMLGKNTKLFKASLFTASGEDMNGLVSDDQRGYDPHSEIAQFFLRRFLGCRLKRANDVTTKAFFEASQDWINSEVVDETKKARYEIALLAQMNAPSRTIAIKDFAEASLDTEDRTPYKEYVGARGVPSTSIAKDNNLIELRIRQLTYATTQGLRLTGTHEKMQELVEVKPDGPDGPVIEVRDGLKDVRGGR